MPRLSGGAGMYDSRPASFPAPRADSWSIPTNVAQATMPASAQAASPSRTTAASAYAAAAVSHDTIEAATSVASSTARVRRGARGQSQRGIAMTSASETRRSSGSSTAPAGRTTTAAPCPARARSARAMNACAERPRSARHENRAKSPAVAVRAKVASRPTAAATTANGSTAVSTPRTAVVIGVTALLPGSGAAFDSVAVVTATDRTVGGHGADGRPSSE